MAPRADSDAGYSLVFFVGLQSFVLCHVCFSQLFGVFNRSMERLITVIGSSLVFLSRSCLVFSIEVWNDFLPSAGPPRLFSPTMEVTSLRLPASFTVVVTCCHVLVYRVSARASAGVFSVRGFKVTTTAYVQCLIGGVQLGMATVLPFFVVRRIRHFSLYAE